MPLDGIFLSLSIKNREPEGIQDQAIDRRDRQFRQKNPRECRLFPIEKNTIEETDCKFTDRKPDKKEKKILFSCSLLLHERSFFVLKMVKSVNPIK